MQPRVLEPAPKGLAVAVQIVAGGKHPVLAVKSAGLSEWFGRQLASKEATRFAVNPDLRRAKHLRDWYAAPLQRRESLDRHQVERIVHVTSVAIISPNDRIFMLDQLQVVV